MTNLPPSPPPPSEDGWSDEPLQSGPLAGTPAAGVPDSAHPGRDERVARIEGVAVIALGAVVALAGLLDWYSISFGGLKGTVNAFETSDNEDFEGWIANVPVGWILLFLGLVVIAAGVLWLRSERHRTRLSAAIAGVGLLTLIVVFFEKRQFDSAFSDMLEDSINEGEGFEGLGTLLGASAVDASVAIGFWFTVLASVLLVAGGAWYGIRQYLGD